MNPDRDSPVVATMAAPFAETRADTMATDDTGVEQREDTGVEQREEDTGVEQREGNSGVEQREDTGVEQREEDTGVEQREGNSGVEQREDTGVEQREEDTGVEQREGNSGVEQREDTGVEQREEDTGVEQREGNSGVEQREEDSLSALDLYLETVEADGRTQGMCVPPSPWHMSSDCSADIMYSGLGESPLAGMSPTTTTTLLHPSPATCSKVSTKDPECRTPSTTPEHTTTTSPSPVKTAPASPSVRLSRRSSSLSTCSMLRPSPSSRKAVQPLSTSESLSTKQSQPMRDLHRVEKQSCQQQQQQWDDSQCSGDDMREAGNRRGFLAATMGDKQAVTRGDNQELMVRYRQMRSNMVLLCLTARREMQRKDQVIAQLRRALNSKGSRCWSGLETTVSDPAQVGGAVQDTCAVPQSSVTSVASQRTDCKPLPHSQPVSSKLSCVSVDKDQVIEKQTQTNSCTPVDKPTQTDSLTSINKRIQTYSCTSINKRIQTYSLTSVNKRIQTDAPTPVEKPTQTDSVTPVDKPTQTDSLTPVDKPTQTDSMTPVDKPTQTDSLNFIDKPTQTYSLTSVNKRIQTDALTPVDKPTQTKSLTPVNKQVQTELVTSMVVDQPVQTESLRDTMVDQPGQVDMRPVAVDHAVCADSLVDKKPAETDHVVGEAEVKAVDLGGMQSFQKGVESLQTDRKGELLGADDQTTMVTAEMWYADTVNSAEVGGWSGVNALNSAVTAVLPCGGPEVEEDPDDTDGAVCIHSHAEKLCQVEVGQQPPCVGRKRPMGQWPLQQMGGKRMRYTDEDDKDEGEDGGENSASPGSTDTMHLAGLSTCPQGAPRVWGPLRAVQGEAWKCKLLLWLRYHHCQVSRREEINAAFSGQNDPQIYDWTHMSWPKPPLLSPSHHALQSTAHNSHSPCSQPDHHSPCSQPDHHSPCSQPDHHSPCSQADHHSSCSQADYHSPCSQPDHHSPCSQADHHSPCSQADYHSPCSQPDHRSPCSQPDHHSPCSQPDHHSPCSQPDHHSPCSQPDHHSPCSQPDHHSPCSQPDHHSPCSQPDHHSPCSREDLAHQPKERGWQWQQESVVDLEGDNAAIEVVLESPKAKMESIDFKTSVYTSAAEDFMNLHRKKKCNESDGHDIVEAREKRGTKRVKRKVKDDVHQQSNSGGDPRCSDKNSTQSVSKKTVDIENEFMDTDSLTTVGDRFMESEKENNYPTFTKTSLLSSARVLGDRRESAVQGLFASISVDLVTPLPAHVSRSDVEKTVLSPGEKGRGVVTVNTHQDDGEVPGSSSVNTHQDDGEVLGSSSVNTHQDDGEVLGSSSVNTHQDDGEVPGSSSVNTHQDNEEVPSSSSVNTHQDDEEVLGSSSVNTHQDDGEVLGSSSVNTHQDDGEVLGSSSVNTHQDDGEVLGSSSVNTHQDDGEVPGSSSVNTHQGDTSVSSLGDSDISIHTDDSDSEEWSLKGLLNTAGLKDSRERLLKPPSRKADCHSLATLTSSSSTHRTGSDGYTCEHDPAVKNNEADIRVSTTTCDMDCRQDDSGAEVPLGVCTSGFRQAVEGGVCLVSSNTTSAHESDHQGGSGCQKQASAPGSEASEESVELEANQQRTSKSVATGLSMTHVTVAKEGQNWPPIICDPQHSSVDGVTVCDPQHSSVDSVTVCDPPHSPVDSVTVCDPPHSPVDGVTVCDPPHSPVDGVTVCDPPHNPVDGVTVCQSAETGNAHMPEENRAQRRSTVFGIEVPMDEGEMDIEEETKGGEGVAPFGPPVCRGQLPVTPKKHWLQRTKTEEGATSTATNLSLIWSPDKTSYNVLGLREPMSHHTFHNLLGFQSLPSSSSSSSSSTQPGSEKERSLGPDGHGGRNSVDQVHEDSKTGQAVKDRQEECDSAGCVADDRWKETTAAVPVSCQQVSSGSLPSESLLRTSGAVQRPDLEEGEISSMDCTTAVSVSEGTEQSLEEGEIRSNDCPWPEDSRAVMTSTVCSTAENSNFTRLRETPTLKRQRSPDSCPQVTATSKKPKTTRNGATHSSRNTQSLDSECAMATAADDKAKAARGCEEQGGWKGNKAAKEKHKEGVWKGEVALREGCEEERGWKGNKESTSECSADRGAGEVDTPGQSQTRQDTHAQPRQQHNKDGLEKVKGQIASHEILEEKVGLKGYTIPKGNRCTKSKGTKAQEDNSVSAHSACVNWRHSREGGDRKPAFTGHSRHSRLGEDPSPLSKHSTVTDDTHPKGPGAYLSHYCRHDNVGKGGETDNSHQCPCCFVEDGRNSKGCNRKDTRHSRDRDDRDTRHSRDRDTRHSRDRDDRDTRHSTDRDNRDTRHSRDRDNRDTRHRDNRDTRHSRDRDNRDTRHSSDRDDRDTRHSRDRDDRDTRHSKDRDNRDTRHSTDRDNRDTRHSRDRNNRDTRHSRDRDDRDTRHSRDRDNRDTKHSRDRDDRDTRHRRDRNNRDTRHRRDRDNRGTRHSTDRDNRDATYSRDRDTRHRRDRDTRHRRDRGDRDTRHSKDRDNRDTIHSKDRDNRDTRHDNRDRRHSKDRDSRATGHSKKEDVGRHAEEQDNKERAQRKEEKGPAGCQSLNPGPSARCAVPLKAGSRLGSTASAHGKDMDLQTGSGPPSGEQECTQFPHASAHTVREAGNLPMAGQKCENTKPESAQPYQSEEDIDILGNAGSFSESNSDNCGADSSGTDVDVDSSQRTRGFIYYRDPLKPRPELEISFEEEEEEEMNNGAGKVEDDDKNDEEDGTGDDEENSYDEESEDEEDEDDSEPDEASDSNVDDDDDKGDGGGVGLSQDRSLDCLSLHAVEEGDSLLGEPSLSVPSQCGHSGRKRATDTRAVECWQCHRYCRDQGQSPQHHPADSACSKSSHRRGEKPSVRVCQCARHTQGMQSPARGGQRHNTTGAALVSRQQYHSTGNDHTHREQHKSSRGRSHKQDRCRHDKDQENWCKCGQGHSCSSGRSSSVGSSKE